MPPALAANLHEILNSENPLTQSDLTALETAVSGSQLTEVRQGVGDLARRVETGEKSEGVLARAGVGSYLLARQDRRTVFCHRSLKTAWPCSYMVSV